MFSIYSTSTNLKCFHADEIVIAANAGIAVALPNPGDAKKAFVQVFTDSDGVAAIGSDKLGYTPIATISEAPEAATQGTPSNGKGFPLYNFGIYEISMNENITQATIMSFATGYKVYCRIQYFK